MATTRQPLAYQPKSRPDIIDMAQRMHTIQTETPVLSVNDLCAIVDRPRMHIVGVQVEHTPQSEYDAVRLPQQLIADGTCALLERLAGNVSPGKYVAAMADVKSGNEFTYIIGVEVADFDHLPDHLPRNTVTLVCPEGRYAKQDKLPDGNAKQSMCRLSDMNLYKECGYAYDPRTAPYYFFDAQGELLSCYEPVRQPGNDQERYASVGWEIVTLPDLYALGCTGEGIDCMFALFGIENEIDWQAAGCTNMHQYLSWGFQKPNSQSISFMGRRVTADAQIPAGSPAALVPKKREGGLYVRFWQQQIDNDNAWLMWDGAMDACFFQQHPEWERNYQPEDGFDLMEHQYEQGTSVYVPIKRKE